MRVAKDWRRAALQALYILDRGGDPAPESLTAALEGSAASEADRAEGVDLQQAWAQDPKHKPWVESAGWCLAAGGSVTYFGGYFSTHRRLVPQDCT